MSAAHARDNVVPINAAAAANPADDWNPDASLPEDIEAEIITNRWNSEMQLLGALMWLTAAEVQQILTYVHDDDIWNPQTRWAIEIIRAVTADGQDPNPTIIAAAAKKQPPAGESFPGMPREWTVGGQGSRYHRLTLHVANAYTNVVGYGTTACFHAGEVLDDSYRRAFLEHGIRMQQMAEAMADVEDLTDYATGYFRGNLRDIWTRRNQLIKHRHTTKETNQ